MRTRKIKGIDEIWYFTGLGKGKLDEIQAEKEILGTLFYAF